MKKVALVTGAAAASVKQWRSSTPVAALPSSEAISQATLMTLTRPRLKCATSAASA